MKIALLGGGMDIYALPQALSSLCSSVDCYLAPRHAREIFDGKTLTERLNDSGIRNFIVDDESAFQLLIKDKGYDLVFGLGPAWILSEKTISLANRWVNINPIPIPKYLGGAHSTWQLLHHDDLGSIIFQEISFPVDRGQILARFDFTYSSEHSNPEARLAENSRQLIRIINEAVSRIVEKPNHVHDEVDFLRREYWPRLNTETHGWIDWHWTGLEIVRFVQAFGQPYVGAHSELLGEKVYFENAIFLESKYLHPFSAGIIVRSNTLTSLDVAVKDGFLRVAVKLPAKSDLQYIEGLRFHTPVEKLELAKRINLRSGDM